MLQCAKSRAAQWPSSVRSFVIVRVTTLVTVHHIQLYLADFHGSNIITDKNISSLSEFHERIDRFQERQ
jgi:hypothetical protein